MRTLRFPRLCLALLAIVAAATMAHGQSDEPGPALSLKPDENIQVVYAVYGGVTEDKTAAHYENVTDKVIALLKKSPDGFLPAQDTLITTHRSDLVPSLIIVYNYGQNSYFYNVPEGAGIVNVPTLRSWAKLRTGSKIGAVIPPTSAAFRVVFATYGVGDAFLNSTDQVTKLLHDQPDGFPITDDDMGGDPHPGWQKSLIVIYDDSTGRYFYSLYNLDSHLSKTDLLDAARPKPAATASASSPSSKLDITSGLILHYDFDNQLGDLVRDVSNQGNDGAASGVIWTGEGHKGGAASFTGGSYITVPHSPALNPAQFTLAVWIKTTQSNDDFDRLFDKNDSTGYTMSVGGTGHGWAAGTTSVDVGGSWTQNNASVVDGKWHHVVGVYNGAQVKSYVDGQLSGNPVDRSGYKVTVTSDLTLGMNRAVPGDKHAYSGLMDDVMIFNRALSADEVHALFVSQGGPPPSATPSTPFGTPGKPSPSAPNPFGASTDTNSAAHATPTVKLPESQSRAVVLISGDHAEGTGFLIKTIDGPAVITNLHVIGNNPNLKITTSSGALVSMLSAKGAADRDLAELAIKDAGYSYLDASADISQTVQPGDEVVTPGNSQGGEVMLNTAGKILGIGPERIEFDNPIYHGNSGGPVIHTKTGKVLGVVTEAMKVDTSDELDKASFANRNSAIGSSMRYFGLRLDTVSSWVPIDWNRFQVETTFLDQFHQRSRCLDSFLNTSPKDPPPTDSDALDPNLWSTDDKIHKANDAYVQFAAGDADASQRLDAVRQLQSDLEDIAALDVHTLQNLPAFYSFDRDRAVDEVHYRKALRQELETLSNNLSRLSGMARSNN